MLARGWAITAGMKANRQLRVKNPAGGWRYLFLSQYASGLIAAVFQKVDWPDEDGSARSVYAHLVQTFVKKLGPCQVLVVKDTLDQPLKEVRFWATSERGADIAMVVTLGRPAMGHRTFFADVKEVFGADQYQLRSALGLVHVWHLAPWVTPTSRSA